MASHDADGLEANGMSPSTAEVLVRALRAVDVHARLIQLGRAGGPIHQQDAHQRPRAGTIHLGDLRPARALQRIWRLDPPDLVHAHGRVAVSASLDAAASAPVVATLGPLPHDAPSAHRAPGDAELAREAALVVATSRAECRRLLSGGLPGRAIAYVPPAVDLDRHRATAWQRRPSGTGRFTVGHVASEEPWGGTTDLLAALAEVPSAAAIVIDPGGRSGGAIERAAGRLGVHARVQVVSAAPRTPATWPLADCDLVVCCPRVEVVGRLALEALACGIPVVATRVGGLINIVGHEATGLHVRPAAPDALAAALRTMAAEPARRQLYGLAARNRVRRHALDRVGRHASLAYGQAVTTWRGVAEPPIPSQANDDLHTA